MFFATGSLEDTTLHAKFVPLTTVSYDWQDESPVPDGASLPSSSEYADGDSKIPPNVITGQGYHIASWSKDPAGKEPYDWNSPHNGSDETVYIRLEPNNHSIGFEWCDGDVPEGVAIPDTSFFKYGDIAELPQPEANGYRFVGWYKDKNGDVPYDADSKINDDMTVLGKWQKVNNDEQPQ